MTGHAPESWSLHAGIALTAGEGHVWRFPLDPPTAVFERFDATLSDDERRRAERFRAGHLRRRYIAGRGGLRAILAAYLDCPAEQVTFQYGPHGKPSLAFGTSFEFNLTHSHELALCALTRVGRIGVDVEELRPMEEHGRKLIGRFFSEAEQGEFLSVPEAEQLASFFRAWTRKEAFLKAVGTGLATVLDSFDVTLGPDVPPALLRVADDPDASTRWSVFDLDPGAGYAAALVVEANGQPIRVRIGDLAPGSFVA
jgi:4'-phosphopantetheinyl transferase